MDLEIVNDGERGLIARDRETGEEVPVPIDELDVQNTYSEDGTFESLSSEDADIHAIDAPAIQPQFSRSVGTQKHDLGGFVVGPQTGALHLTVLTDLSSVINGEPEGITYDGQHLYVGEDTGGSGAATIHKLNTDGSETGETFTFADSSFNHTNTIEWVDGELWVADANAFETKIVDFDAGTVVDTIAHEGSVSGTIWVGSIPTTQQVRKLIFRNYTGTDAYLVDADGARADGTTSGNIETALNAGDASRSQAIAWRDGHLYISKHGELQKVSAHHADEMAEGYPLGTGDGIEWNAPNNWDTLEDLTFNHDTNEWYVLDSNQNGAATQGILSGSEQYGTQLPTEWDQFSVVSGGVLAPFSLSLDSDVSSSTHVVQFSQNSLTGWVEAWVFDDLATTDKKTYITVNKGGGGFGSRTLLSINTAQTNGDTNYYWWTDTDGWTDTGVARPDTARWVGFGFYLTGGNCEFYVSTDLGQTWQAGGSTSNGSSTVAQTGVQADLGVTEYSGARVVPTFQP